MKRVPFWLYATGRVVTAVTLPIWGIPWLLFILIAGGSMAAWDALNAWWQEVKRDYTRKD